MVWIIINIADILEYRDKAKIEEKSDEYIRALSDFYSYMKNKELKQRESYRKLVRERRKSESESELVTLYFYERTASGSIRKSIFKAEEKANSYIVFNCWRNRLSKNYDINKYTDCLHHAMWTDAENDELMEKLLDKY